MAEDVTELRERIERCKFLLRCIDDPQFRGHLQGTIIADQARLARLERRLTGTRQRAYALSA
jgi:hypothetical protein